ncbi:hypothetical protein ACLOJK_011776, partial [Asimina triloba]
MQMAAKIQPSKQASNAACSMAPNQQFTDNNSIYTTVRSWKSSGLSNDIQNHKFGQQQMQIRAAAKGRHQQRP